jgi:hypothetical protein
MTQKTVEELYKEYIKKFLTSEGRYPEPDEVFLAGYNSAQTPNWTKLPELPKEKYGHYLITRLYKGDPERKYVTITEWKKGKFAKDNIVAWKPLPEPFKGDAC